MNNFVLLGENSLQHEYDAAPFAFLQGIILDWAGTMVDCGCQGPVQAFVRSFAAFGISITESEAREPMGMGKLDHVEALLAMPRIRDSWRQEHGFFPDSKARDAIYAHVEKTMAQTILEHCAVIPGSVPVLNTLRKAGLFIGSCTGYPRCVAVIMAEQALQQGLQLDCLVCANDVASSRPAPDMCNRVFKDFTVSDAWRTVKIGDTVQDVQEGKNAGMWTIGVCLTSNLIGLSAEALRMQTPHEQKNFMRKSAQILSGAGADLLIPDISMCVQALRVVDRWCSEGKRPCCAANFLAPTSD